MNLERLYQILDETTALMRKGERVTGAKHLVDAVNKNEPLDGLPGGVVTIDNMPHTSEAPANVTMIDLDLVVVGVDPNQAAKHKAELLAILKTYPDRAELASGPSYLNLGYHLDDQGRALELIALGEVAGIWKAVTPSRLGIKDEATIQNMAGGGYVMCTGLPQGE